MSFPQKLINISLIRQTLCFAKTRTSKNIMEKLILAGEAFQETDEQGKRDRNLAG
jgi:hypothetical protein